MGVSEFPSSRVHLWSTQPTGKMVHINLSNKSVGSIVISEHVLRRAAKLCSPQQAGFDCYLLGTANVSNDSVSICVDRMDQGKEIISDGKIVKVPTMLIPGDMIIPTKILSEEDTITFTTDQYIEAFSDLEEYLKKQSHIGDLLKIKCLISLMPDDDLGTPLKVTCEMVHPGLGFDLKPISSLPLASTPITRALSGDLAGVTKFGYLTLDRARRGVLILSSDTAGISDTILIGSWISLPLSHPINSDSAYPLGPAIWCLLTDYIFKQDIIRESPPPAPFLLCVLSGGTVLTWECTVNSQLPSFKHIKCTSYVVVPDSHISDTTTFHLRHVDPNSVSHKMFTSALKTVRHNLWERVDDIEPRAAPSATPTSKASKSAGAPLPQRSVSPLSILAPSCPGSLFVPAARDLKETASLEKSMVEDLGSKNKSDIDKVFTRKGKTKESVQENGLSSRKQAPFENGLSNHVQNGYPETLHPPTPDLSQRDGSLDPTYPPNSLLSPTAAFPGSPFDPRFMYPRNEPNSDMYAVHSRQGSDPYSAVPGIHSPMSPYYFNPYLDPMRYQYPYHPYPPMYHGVPHNVPAFYPPNYSDPSRRSKKPSKEKSAFCALGRSSPNKRTNHRSPEKSSFSSANKSMCSTSTVSSRDSGNNSSRSKRGGRSSAKKQLYPEHDMAHMTRSLKSSASSSVSERRKDNCIRDALDKSSRSSRTASSQSESASISAKALKMLTLQKRQLDHLQQQVSLLMKNAHTTAQPTSNVVSLDKSIESMRTQMEILEQQIDKDVSSSTGTSDMCVGTGESLVLTTSTGTNMTRHQISDHSVQCSHPCSHLSDHISSSHQYSHVSERSVQCSEAATGEGSDEDSVSFYLRFKENEDPHKSNRWDSSGQFVKFNSKAPSPKYHEHSIFQHPKIQAPALSHSIYNSMYFDDDMDKSVFQPRNKSPEKTEFSVASRKYLEKHQLVSPPTKHVDKKKKRPESKEKEKADKIIYMNGKILQLRNSTSDPETIDLRRLQLK